MRKNVWLGHFKFITVTLIFSILGGESLSPLMALNFPLEPLNFDAKTCWQISPDFLRERQTARAEEAAWQAVVPALKDLK